MTAVPKLSRRAAWRKRVGRCPYCGQRPVYQNFTRDFGMAMYSHDCDDDTEWSLCGVTPRRALIEWLKWVKTGTAEKNSDAQLPLFHLEALGK